MATTYARQTITITDTRGNNPQTVPAHGDPSVRREGACVDLVLEGQIHIGAPIGARILLRTDGTWVHWQTYYDASNWYLHISVAYSGSPPPPTVAQRETVSEWWADATTRPYGIFIGQSLYDWAFGDGEPLGRDGRRVLLA